MEDNKVKTVSEFLNQVNRKLQILQKRNGTSLFAYRGEEQEYQTSGMPNIFRERVTSTTFEKNILDEVVSNGLSEGGCYLHRAIDAQHGGFPSRLLDITFNSTIALFFAVTPHFSKPIDYCDNKDSVVIIYAIREMFSVDSSAVQDYYEKQINQETRPMEVLNHIFLDHSKRNTRISAQYGGFILFSGSKFNPLPQFYQEKIIIDGASKKNLREELKKIFGLTMGNVYPESDHFVAYLKEKADILSNDINGMVTSNLLQHFIRELDYYSEEIIDELKNQKNIEKLRKKVLMFEEYIFRFIFVLKEDDCFKDIETKIEKKIRDTVDRLNYISQKEYNYNIVLFEEFSNIYKDSQKGN